MQAAVHPRNRKKIHLGRIIVVTIALFIVIEPIVMYRSLVRERDQRQAARELMMQVAAGDAGK